MVILPNFGSFAYGNIKLFSRRAGPNTSGTKMLS